MYFGHIDGNTKDYYLAGVVSKGRGYAIIIKFKGKRDVKWYDLQHNSAKGLTNEWSINDTLQILDKLSFYRVSRGVYNWAEVAAKGNMSKSAEILGKKILNDPKNYGRAYVEP